MGCACAVVPDEMILFSGNKTQLKSPPSPPVVSISNRFGANFTAGT